MKMITLLGTMTLTVTLFTGCMSSIPVRGDSVAAQSMGSDTALINAGRGRADAQVSVAQEKQYDRQRRVAEKEQEYQDRQDQRAHKQRQRSLSTFGSVLSIFK